MGFNAGKDSDEYEYDDEVTTRNKTSGGTRLVGARTGNSHEAPFVVAINTHGWVVSLPLSSCKHISADNRRGVFAQDL